MRQRFVLVLAVVAALLASAVAALPSVGWDALAATAHRASAPGWVTTAKQRLSKLDTNAAASMTGYSRAKFGKPWEDVDLNRCDTRNDILARDLTKVVLKTGSKCTVAKGMLNDPYTNTTITFVRGPSTSGKVQIDHVVALAAAWRTGAKKWTSERRLFYANDTLVLLAVDGPTNGAKGDKDAAGWLPPNAAYHCRYLAKQIAIKTKYELWVTPPERTAIADALNAC